MEDEMKKKEKEEDGEGLIKGGNLAKKNLGKDFGGVKEEGEG